MNAALKYWAAMVNLPGHPRRTYWEVASGAAALTSPIKDAEFLFTGSGVRVEAVSSLEHLRAGSVMPYCEWGRTTDPYHPAEHVQRAPLAAGLVLLHARLQYSQGHIEAAVDDMTAAWRFSSHLASDRTPASWGVSSYIMTEMLTPLTARWMVDLDPMMLRALDDCLRSLPEPPSLCELAGLEKAMWLTWFRDSVSRHGMSGPVERFREYGELTDALEAELTGDPNVDELLGEIEQLYDDYAQIASRPIHEVETLAPEFQQRIESSNHLARLALGQQTLVDRQKRESRRKATLAMIQAACKYQLKGPAGLQSVPDPFGDGPFRFMQLSDGFTLSSALTIDATPVSLTFRRNDSEAQKAQSRLLIYDSQSDPVDDIQEALKIASADGKRVLLQWGFNGCIPCYELHRMFEDNEPLSALLQKHYRLVSMDVTNNASAELIKRYRADGPVPHLTILDSSGNVLVNVKPSGQFTTLEGLDANLVREFLEQWSGQPQGDGP
jgi:hypothetical protein